MTRSAAIRAAASVEPLPGVPPTELIVDALATMARPIIDSKLTIDDGPQLTADGLESELAIFLAERPSFTAVGSGRTEMTVRWMDFVAPGLPRTGSINTYMTVDVDDIGPILEAVASAAQTLHAPFAYVDQFDDGFRNRRAQHRTIYQQDQTGADRVFGLMRGFSGIAWRTVLGPATVEFFGADALGRLPDSLARQVADGYWLLTPCTHPDDWTPERYCDDERQIIETLGPNRFFDPETGALPTVLPVLPDVSPVASTARERDADGEWQWKSYDC